MIRRLGVLALVLVTGCSLLWPMSDYDGSAPARDGGPNDATTATSSGGSSSGGSSGSSNDDASSAADAEAGASKTCILDDPEPNDAPGQAVDLPPGRTCGKIEDTGDQDYFTATATGTMLRLDIVLPAGVQLTVTGGQTPLVYQTAGEFTVSFTSGTRDLLFQSFDGTTGTPYTITRTP